MKGVLESIAPRHSFSSRWLSRQKDKSVQSIEEKARLRHMAAHTAGGLLDDDIISPGGLVSATKGTPSAKSGNNAAMSLSSPLATATPTSINNLSSPIPASPGKLGSPIDGRDTLGSNNSPMSPFWSWLGYQPPEDQTVHEAARQRDLGLLKALTRRTPKLARAPGKGGVTPLMLSAQVGHLESVQYLISALNVSASTRDASGLTALHHLVIGGLDSPVVAVELLTKGHARVDDQDDGGRTALHYAALNGLSNTVKVLLQYEASPLITDEEQLDTLAYAGRCVKPDEAAEIRKLIGDAQARWKDKVGDRKSWSCSCPSLCGEDNAAADEHDFEALSPSKEHPLRAVFKKGGITNPEAIEVYMENLRRMGYDNIVSLKSITTEKQLGRYVPDVGDRKRLTKALQDEYPVLPEPHLPTGQFLRELLNTSEDQAERYAEALRSSANIYTGSQLLALGSQSYDTIIDPALHMAPVGHKRALRVILQTRKAKALYTDPCR